eukprot:m.1080136 g.1080136  ORF g.1080136 m.1080136 type:complete len:135 (+) comp24255_c0_seq17:102-506(+)
MRIVCTETLCTVNEHQVVGNVYNAGVAVCGDEDTGVPWEEFHQNASIDPDVAAVVVGLDFQLNYVKLSHACMYIRSGVPFIITNRDAASPLLADGGIVPGNGAIIECLVKATGIEPINCGKPSVWGCVPTHLSY